MCRRQSRCSTVTCAICRSVTGGEPNTCVADRKYWGVRTMRLFRTCRSVGKKFTAAVFKEKRLEPTKTIGMGKKDLTGLAGRFAPGRPLKAPWEGSSSLQ